MVRTWNLEGYFLYLMRVETAAMGSLSSLLGKSPRVAIIEVFAENPTVALSVPEIVADSGVSKRGAYIHVARLCQEGVVRKSHKVGKCWYYRANEADVRGRLLGFLESIFTLGRLEAEIKRDRALPPTETLAESAVLLTPEVTFELGAQGEIARKGDLVVDVNTDKQFFGIAGEQPTETILAEFRGVFDELDRELGKAAVSFFELQARYRVRPGANPLKAMERAGLQS